MSVIVKDMQKEEIRLLCKGADSVIEKRLSAESYLSDVYKFTEDTVN